MARIRACVFDAYGTLYDVHSAVRRLAAEIGPAAEPLSRDWRARQLEYSWVRSLMGRHVDFWTVTGEALDTAMALHGLEDNDLRRRLLDAYRRLSAYPEVTGVLRQLKSKGLAVGVLSNGSPEMLADAASSAGLDHWIDMTWSVEAVGVYKPDARVYRLACDGLRLKPEEISFQSSNRWDAAGAANFGFHVVWVNRAGLPDEYRFAGPVQAVTDLSYLANVIDPPVWRPAEA
ncbi:MAG: haloacid dehalogenase type II [Ferrovibrionaceae bacterium]